MSADNYLLVRPDHNGEWWVTMEFASDEEPMPLGDGWKLGPFRTRHDATDAAFEEERKDYYEYGVSVIGS